jgi:hypothetical protein
MSDVHIDREDDLDITFDPAKILEDLLLMKSRHSPHDGGDEEVYDFGVVPRGFGAYHSHQGREGHRGGKHRTNNTSHSGGPRPYRSGSQSANTEAGSDHQSPANDPNNRYFRAELYKTKMCRSYEMGRSCAFEEYCCYAHSDSELRSVEQNVAEGITKPFNVRQFQKERLHAKGGYRAKTAKAQAFKEPPHASNHQAPLAAGHASNAALATLLPAGQSSGNMGSPYVPSPIQMYGTQPMMFSPPSSPVYVQQTPQGPMYVQQPMYMGHHQPQVVYVPVPVPMDSFDNYDYEDSTTNSPSAPVAPRPRIIVEDSRLMMDSKRRGVVVTSVKEPSKDDNNASGTPPDSPIEGC